MTRVDGPAAAAGGPDGGTDGGGIDGGGGGVGGVTALRDAAGPFVRPLQRVVRALLAGPGTIPELVAASGAPRREVEQLLAALGAGVERHGDRYLVPPGSREELAAAAGVADLDGRELDDVVGRRLAARPDLVATLAELARERPRPDRDLDHVAATPVTVARRALWLDSCYDLRRTRVLCVGDHDLTSLAIAACTPGAQVTVVDLDDRILEFVDTAARRNGWPVRCLWGDLRFGLPASAHGTAGLAVTDPPYTPEGVSTFVVAALQGLADPEHGRVVVAYGYGDHQPALGLKVQQAVADLHVAFEAILPGFNTYQGAQAIGSRSDLYVCRPTARTWRALPALAARGAARIYTHGRQSLESGGPVPDGVPDGVPSGAPGGSGEGPDAAAAALAEALADAGRRAPGGRLLLVGDRWPKGGAAAGAQRSSVGAVLARGLPPQLGAGRDVRALVDLTGAPAAWLPRVLLALDVGLLAAVVPAGGAAGSAGGRADGMTVADLLADRYDVRTRPLPGGRFDLVTATPDPPGSSAVARDLLRRAHGRLGNAWREALVSAARARGVTLTKNQARALVEAACPEPDVRDLRLVEAPRHLLELVVRRARESGD